VNDAYQVNRLYNPTMGTNLDDPSHPLLSDGFQASGIASASEAVAFAVLRPHNSVADDNIIDQTWVDSSEVAIRYSSGVRVYVKQWPQGSDPAGWYKTSQARTGAGTVETIGGNPCWYADKGAAGNGFPVDAFVDISIGNVDIAITGTASLNDLLSAAASVK
jgi:hypothetical protein